jgi:hypothetical protein
MLLAIMMTSCCGCLESATFSYQVLLSAVTAVFDIDVHTGWCHAPAAWHGAACMACSFRFKSALSAVLSHQQFRPEDISEGASLDA